MRLRTCILACILLVSIVRPDRGYGLTTSIIKGLVFADYYYGIKNHDSSLKNQNAFQFRRVYFTFENNITENVRIRFRIESKHPKFEQSGPINPFIKHAYLEWNGLISGHKLYLGIAETNAFKNAEDYWGYRSVEATIMDLNKISSSADMGMALKGDVGRTVHHWLTVYNGTGYQNAEQDKYKKIGYAVWFTPVDGLILEGYIDYEKQDRDNAISSARDYFGASSYRTLKGFFGYRTSGFTVGAEWFRRTNKQSGSADAGGTSRTDVNKQGFSFFGSCVTPIPKIKVFARYDLYDPNTKDNVWVSDSVNGVDDETSFVFGGIDFTPNENVHFMPNIIVQNYALEGKGSDVTVRVTLWYEFNSGKIEI
ncbi:hypothetical protein JW824_02415 [bacterium]|nr:hypothetical protein [bacterium]RQV93260.1 MAG: hypothetical protein EH221_09810 [bacterium]